MCVCVCQCAVGQCYRIEFLLLTNESPGKAVSLYIHVPLLCCLAHPWERAMFTVTWPELSFVRACVSVLLQRKWSCTCHRPFANADFFAKYINIPSARGTAAGYHIDVIRRSGSTWRTQRDFSPFANCIQCVGVLLIWPTAYSFHILIDFLFLILESV